MASHRLAHTAFETLKCSPHIMAVKGLDRDIVERIERRRFKIKDKDMIEVVEKVFDIFTVEAVNELARRGVIDVLYGAVAEGKEGRVFWGRAADGTDLAVKIFYTTTAKFIKGRHKYMAGDRRVEEVRRDIRSIVYAWCRREFSNLKRAYGAGVSVPKPIAFYRNVLVMEFVGSEGRPAPLLKDSNVENPREVYLELLRNVERALILGGIVHGDLSEYNVMYLGDRVVIIDWGNAVRYDHPKALELLRRDIANLSRYFSEELGVEVYDVDRVYNAMVKRFERRREGVSSRNGWVVVGGETLLDVL